MFSCIVKHEITGWRAHFTSLTVRQRVDWAMLRAVEEVMLGNIIGSSTGAIDWWLELIY